MKCQPCYVHLVSKKNVIKLFELFDVAYSPLCKKKLIEGFALSEALNK